MTALRISILTLALVGLSWFSFINEAPAAELRRSVVDAFDPRPARTILLVGNSRTYSNDMPAMIRKIADSAGTKEKYQVVDRSAPGAYFRDHWSNPRLRRLLQNDRWNAVILQGASGEHVTRKTSKTFQLYGTKLAQEAEEQGSSVFLISAWDYGPLIRQEFEEWHSGSSRRYYNWIQGDYRSLVRRTGADLINVGAAWKDVQNARPPFELLLDGNHPSVHGSYLYALLVYHRLSGVDLERVTFVPEGVSPAEGALIRKLAAHSLKSRSRATG
jgi:hypothetical protein